MPGKKLEISHVHIDRIKPNDYNSNAMADVDFELLCKSIKTDGYTQPILCCSDNGSDHVIIDGYYRYLAMKKHREIYDAHEGCLPTVCVEGAPAHERIAMSIRHNRARGANQVDKFADMLRRLINSGATDDWIAENTGILTTEMLRLRQLTGLADLFKDNELSMSWTVEN